MEASELLVFAGAGLSIPSKLPGFDALASEAVQDLGLKAYLPGGDRAAVLKDMAPEAFMGAMRDSGIDVRRWLFDWLDGGEPGYGHVIVAELAARGVAIWTVNFDELIENAALAQGHDVEPPWV